MSVSPLKINIRPINLTDLDVRRIINGQCTQQRRFGSVTFDMTETGDWLWVREPFRFWRRFDHWAPRQITSVYRQPEISFDADPSIGRPVMSDLRRPARTLPRSLSRLVLVVTGVRRAPLQSWKKDDEAAIGISPAEYAIHWDQNRQTAATFAGPLPLGHRGNRLTGLWSENPLVTIVDFHLVKKNVDDLLATLAKHQTAPKKPARITAQRPDAGGRNASTPVPDAAADTALRADTRSAARPDTNLTGTGDLK